jgi:hypothetical protein
MVLTILNLTLVPSILIFDFGSISGDPATSRWKIKPSKIKKVFDEQETLLPFQLEHWTLELKAKLSQMELIGPDTKN